MKADGRLRYIGITTSHGRGHAEFDCASWGQLFLKWMVSHPPVTSAIPATSKVHHRVDNMGAGFGRLPEAAMRRRLVSWFAAL